MFKFIINNFKKNISFAIVKKLLKIRLVDYEVLVKFMINDMLMIDDTMILIM